MKLESDKRVVCDGSCSECPRCLMLYICNAVDCGGISAWRTWLGSRIALPNSDAVLRADSSRYKEPCIRWVPRSPKSHI